MMEKSVFSDTVFLQPDCTQNYILSVKLVFPKQVILMSDFGIFFTLLFPKLKFLAGFWEFVLFSKKKGVKSMFFIVFGF